MNSVWVKAFNLKVKISLFEVKSRSNLPQQIAGHIKQFQIGQHNPWTWSSSKMIRQDLCRLMKFTSDGIDVSHWIKFIRIWKVFFVELNAWNSCPEHVIATEWISIDSYWFSNTMYDATICNNRRISKRLENKSHHQWTVSKWFQFIIFFLISSLTEAVHDEILQRSSLPRMRIQLLKRKYFRKLYSKLLHWESPV